MLREFFLDGEGILVSYKGYVIKPYKQYRNGRKIYLLRPGRYQLHFEDDIKNMSREAISNAIKSNNFNVVDVVITRHLIVYQVPSRIINISLLEEES